MPSYVYACLQCDLRFDMIRPVELRDDNVECPDCHETAWVERQLVAPMVNMNGQEAAK
jgi:putative FmdB family regulatory protein